MSPRAELRDLDHGPNDRKQGQRPALTSQRPKLMPRPKIGPGHPPAACKRQKNTNQDALRARAHKPCRPELGADARRRFPSSKSQTQSTTRPAEHQAPIQRAWRRKHEASETFRKQESRCSARRLKPELAAHA
mmetsp:Transcript_42024/g.65707  ORF Transcript_42024/g.65707 Transcript_42024/m.65707 type:complete len:133 (-) Transcript_42024:78-476(-)